MLRDKADAFVARASASHSDEANRLKRSHNLGIFYNIYFESFAIFTYIYNIYFFKFYDPKKGKKISPFIEK